MTTLIFLKHFFIDLLKLVGNIAVLVMLVMLCVFIMDVLGPIVVGIIFVVMVILAMVIKGAWDETKDELAEKEE